MELYDLSDEIVVQERENTSRTLEILKSERPGFKASREIGEEKMRV